MNQHQQYGEGVRGPRGAGGPLRFHMRILPGTMTPILYSLRVGFHDIY